MAESDSIKPHLQPVRKSSDLMFLWSWTHFHNIQTLTELFMACFICGGKALTPQEPFKHESLVLAEGTVCFTENVPPQWPNDSPCFSF